MREPDELSIVAANKLGGPAPAGRDKCGDALMEGIQENDMARGSMIRMKMSDGAEIGVYHVEPKGERRGGLVLIQEIFGVTDHIKR